jgi:hypothetical protein
MRTSTKNKIKGLLLMIPFVVVSLFICIMLFLVGISSDSVADIFSVRLIYLVAAFFATAYIFDKGNDLYHKEY